MIMEICVFCGAHSLEPTVCSCDKDFEQFDDAVEFEIPIRSTPKEASAATWGEKNA